MTKAFKEGDRVQIVDREVTAEDVKSGLFYNHFRGLTGTILKVYANGEVSVEIEVESLAEPLAARHNDVEAQMKTKWLDGLSEEGRNRLSEKERDFRLRYTVLVAMTDLTAPGKRAAAPRSLPADSDSKKADAVAVETPRRPTSADYEAAEEAYLRSRLNNGRE